MNQTSFDVAVVGAGPAGAATAWGLAARGVRVALLERSYFDSPRLGESLAPMVQPLLSELGAWDAFLALAPLPSYGTRSIWGGLEVQEHSHVFSPYGHGWHVDRCRLDRMLAEHAQAAGARLWLGACVRACVPAPGGFRLELARAAVGVAGAGERAPPLIHASLVVDATGRGALLGRSLGGRRVLFDGLVAVAAAFDDEGAAAHGYTQVEATPDGWWYAAPVSAGRSVAMLMTDGRLARPWSRHARWREALRRAPATEERLRGAVLRWGPRVESAVSQRLVRAERRAPWLAVGDAALAVDPLSGSGVVRALRTAAAATRALCAALSGDGDAIAAYEDDRDAECTRALLERAAYYAAEARFRDSPFWHRRVGVLGGYSDFRANTSWMPA